MKKTLNKYSFTPLLILFLSLWQVTGYAGGTPNWELITEKNGIKVYAKPDDRTGFNIYKAEMQVQTDKERVLDVLTDIKNYNRWTPKLDKCELLKSVNDKELYYYSVISAPMVSNRDLIVHLKSYQSGNAMVIDMEGVPDYMPEEDGMVRMPTYKGLYKVTPTTSNQVKISLIYQADPGGNLPKWMVNNHTDQIPYEIFSNLKAIF